MSRALLIAALAALVLPASAQSASVRLTDCVKSPELLERSATFDARMHPVRGTERMQVRLTLQVRQSLVPGWRRAGAVPDRWQTSYPDVRRYSFSRTVRNLAAPASYRAVARFRWLDEHGEAIKRSRAVSRSCRQPDHRPELVATAIVPVDGGYEVTVRNRGPGAAGTFDVALAVGGRTLAPVSVAGLDAEASTAVVVPGPRCAEGELLTATVDAGAAVDERDEDDNRLIASCPP